MYPLAPRLLPPHFLGTILGTIKGIAGETPKRKPLKIKALIPLYHPMNPHNMGASPMR